MNSYHGWHSPLASSLPYISSVSSSYSTERSMLMSMGMSYVYDDNDNELQYPFEEEIASSTEHIQTDSLSSNPETKHVSTGRTSISSTSSTSSNDGSDEEIDEIRRAIDKTLGSQDEPQTINPRMKYLSQLGIGKTQPIPQPQPTQKSAVGSRKSSSSSQTTPRTPPTSPVTDPNDDSLDAMLALMGVTDEMIPTPHVMRSSPIDIPRRVSRPIPIPPCHARPISRPVMPVISHQQHKYDSDDDTDYFDSPQSEDLSGSMLFDY